MFYGFCKGCYLKFYYSQEFWGCEMLIFAKANKVGLETLVLQSLTFRELGFAPGNPIDTDIQRGARRRSLFSLKLALLRVSLPPSRALECLFGGSAAEALICSLRCVATGKMPPKLDPSQVVEVYVRVTGMSLSASIFLLSPNYLWFVPASSFSDFLGRLSA
jgi:hypothetical protein